MKLLAIDTSTEQASVAVVVNHEIIEKTHTVQKQHAQFLLPLIEEVCGDAGIQLNQLSGIVFGCGPGSFTGLRIACSVAKGLAFAHDLPLLPASSLSAINEQVAAEYQHVLALLDARMHQVYWRYFSPAYQGMESVSACADIVLPTDEPVMIAGVGYQSYLETLPLSIRSNLVGDKLVYPMASAMLRLALNNQLSPVSAHTALPTYVRNQVIQGASHG